VFSMGGYVAGPVMLAAARLRVAMVLMEPNAVPGLVSRRMARRVHKALISFPETARWFPPGIAEQAGLPVREAFFALAPREPGEPLRVLVTGGSRGARALNRTVRESWPLFGASVCWILQTGEAEFDAMDRAFRESGFSGRVAPFIADMPAAFGEADLIVGRAGAGACAEICAAGKPAILVPFPYAADDHQTANARALERAGAARCVPESEFTPRRLFELVNEIRPQLAAMGRAARALARPEAARRAADCLEAVSIDKSLKHRNN